MRKLLLTSAGIKNSSIHEAMLKLLGKPIADCNALCIPTAHYGHPMGSPAGAWRFIVGRSSCPMVELGWKSVGVLELTALPSIGAARWIPWVEAADVLLVDGGDALYLCHWMRKSGLAALLPTMDRAVWVGLSAGSTAMTPRIGEAFVETKPPITGDDLALGVVDFSIFPHLDYPGWDANTMIAAERWAASIGGAGVCDRRPDSHQSDRRQGRGRVRGAMEVLCAVIDISSQVEAQDGCGRGVDRSVPRLIRGG